MRAHLWRPRVGPRCPRPSRPSHSTTWQRAAPLASSRDRQTNQDTQQQPTSNSTAQAVASTAVVLAFGAAFVLTAGREQLEDFIYNEALYSSGGFGAGDLTAAALWSGALWFCSPLQLLLLFLGKIETERPSDWALGLLGRGLGLPVDAIDYSAPLWLRAVVAVLCCASGFGIAWASSATLGDATWALSSGVGAGVAAAIYEIGRPQRLTGEEAVALEQQWQDFATWANVGLQRGGKCHEAEIAAAFQAGAPRYRGAGALSKETLRSMVRNWFPEAKRSSTGYYKNVSLRPRSDPFTGQQMGTDLRRARPGAAGGTATGDAGAGGEMASVATRVGDAAGQAPVLAPDDSSSSGSSSTDSRSSAGGGGDASADDGSRL